jgi:hypothetical protein
MMNAWKRCPPAIIAIALLIAGCTSSERAYEAPSGNLLTLEVLSAEQTGPEEAKVSVCYELPSEGDWVLGRLLGDVTLSDGQGSAIMDHFELLALSDSPLRRCDRLFFSRPDGFPPGSYTLTVARLAASLLASQDWGEIQHTLDEADTGIVIASLPDDGRSFALVQRPPEMTDQEASLIVSGLEEPVVIGPWVIPVNFEE